MTKINRVIRIGTTLHKFKIYQGKYIFLPLVLYHLPQTDVQIFSPQTYHQMNGVHSLPNGDAVEMHCKGNRVVIPIQREQASLPIVYNSFLSSKEKNDIVPHIRSAMDYYNLSNIDFFGDLKTSTEMVNGKRGFESMIKNEYEHYTQFCGPCVGASENKNLSNSQKDLLLWNWKWGISMHRIQEMMKPKQVVEPDGTRSVIAPVISPKLANAATCAV